MRCYVLTASVLTALFLSACTAAPQNEGSAVQPQDLTPASSTATRQDETHTAATPQANGTIETMLSQRYQGLDPREISQAEIEELMALQMQQRERNQLVQDKVKAWNAQDPAHRGPPPKWTNTAQTERLTELLNKFQLAEIRKSVGNIDSSIISKADKEEYIELAQAQTRLAIESQKRLSAWAKLDPATRGPQPEMDQGAIMGVTKNARLDELQSKVGIARGVDRATTRINQLSKSHNIPILDSEMSELIELFTAEQTLNHDLQLAIMKAVTSDDGTINAGALGAGQLNAGVIEKLPRDLLLRMSEVSERLDALQAPFEAAERADSIRQNMPKLSEASGVPISFNDIEETVSLNAEKDQILKRTRLEATRKWKAEGGPISAIQKPNLNTQDAARIKEIDARLKEIRRSYE